jgi:hypothetical protein
MFGVCKAQIARLPFQLESRQDHSKPGLTMDRQADGDTAVYPTYPGTDMRDYSEPGYVIEDDAW